MLFVTQCLKLDDKTTEMNLTLSSISYMFTIFHLVLDGEVEMEDRPDRAALTFEEVLLEEGSGQLFFQLRCVTPHSDLAFGCYNPIPALKFSQFNEMKVINRLCILYQYKLRNHL
jgi:hypothetical protein